MLDLVLMYIMKERASNMKTYKTREEIAKAINFKNDLVVITIDVADTIVIGEQVCGYKGCLVNQDFGGEFYFEGHINYLKDTKKVSVDYYGTMLSASFGFHDIMNMIARRNAPVIKNGCKALLVCYNSKTEKCLSPVEFEINGLRKFVSGVSILDNADWIEQLEEKEGK